MADPSPARFSRLLAVRDSMMAANLLALAAQAPTLVHAHNSHLQRDKSSMHMAGAHQQWWSAGALAGARLGAGYAFVATAIGTIHHRGVDAPSPDTVEGRLYAQPEQHSLHDPRKLATEQFTPRVSPWFGYASLDPAHLPAIDGLAFTKDLRSVEP